MLCDVLEKLLLKLFSSEIKISFVSFVIKKLFILFNSLVSSTK